MKKASSDAAQQLPSQKSTEVYPRSPAHVPSVSLATVGTCSNPQLEAQRSECGQLWTWGMGRNGKYDRLTSNLREPRPLNISDSTQLSFSTITSVACSSSHALFTTCTILAFIPSFFILCGLNSLPSQTVSGKVYTLGDKTTGSLNVRQTHINE